MSTVEGSGYVQWLGKGEPHQHEWVARLYQAGNTEGRANRISFYAFNLAGGLGAGSYFQDPLDEGVWLHVVGRIDSVNTSIFRDGDQRDTDPLSGYNIVPQHGSAPVRIATRDLQSFFNGAISRVAIYGAALSAERIRAHYNARGTETYDSLIIKEPDLISYWKLDETGGNIAVDTTGRHTGRYIGNVALGQSYWEPDGHVAGEIGPIIPIHFDREIVSVSASVNSALIEYFEKHPQELKTMDRRLFEEFIAELWAGFGYQVELTQQTRDGGKDIIAIGRHVVTEKFLIECKRPDPDKKVGVRPVRELYAVKTSERATKAILATTACFTTDAKVFFEKHRWELEGQDFDGILSWIRKYQGKRST